GLKDYTICEMGSKTISTSFFVHGENFDLTRWKWG
ncbi:unnamed protein product, partial [marine sediment metagenome]